jgi:autotransporter-associated beta strand protein
MEISLLPSELDDNVRFIYVTAWRGASKKGIAGNIESPLSVQWKYNWNIDQNSTRDTQYIPIRQTRWWPGLGQDWKARGADHVLGYNEPDKADQANIAVGDAIYSWPDLLGTGLRVGAPAVSDGGRSGWLYPFMTQANAANLRVDFVPVHYYWCYTPSDPNGAATQMYNFLKATYDTVKRPLWITEWNNGASWTTCGDPTAAQQRATVAAIIAMLDSTPFVERYAPYNWVEDVRRLEWDDGSLTSAGVTYRDNHAPIGYIQALQDNGTRSYTQLRFETNTLDTSGYCNNGITSGSPAYTNGHAGNALVFDGDNTRVTLPPNVGNSSAFTFAGWINWNGGANWQRIFDFGNSSSQYFFLTPSATGGFLRFAMRNGGSEQTVQTAAPAIGAWTHVAVTLSGSTAKLYVNGALAAQNTGMSITPAAIAPRMNFLGQSQFPADPMFNGAMDDVLITDFALSAAQIAALQTNTPPQFTNSVIARGSASEGILYSNTLAGSATDVDPGDTLTYIKAVGPAWLSISTNGTMTGAPTSGDGGTNYFTMRVVDSAGQNAFALVTINVTVTTAPGTWTADASANWSETSRWLTGIVATGAGQTANFSTINITGNRTITLDTPRTIGNLKFGDASGAQTWTVAGTNGLTLSTGSATAPLLTITNTLTISAPVSGTNGFTKTGTGTLILTGNNPLSGTVSIDTTSSSLNDGITRIVGPNALSSASLIRIGNNNSGNSTLQVDGSAGSVTIDADFTVNYRNNGVVTIQNLAGTNIFNGSFQLFQGGNSHTVQADANSLIVFTGTNQYVGALVGTRTNYFTGVGNHLVLGPMLDSTNGSAISLAKNGTGRLTLGGVNTYGNSTVFNAGSLFVDGVLPAGPFSIATGTTLGGNGVIRPAVTIPSGSTLAPGDNFGPLTVSNNVTLAAGSTTRMEIDRSNGSNDLLIVNGTLTMNGTLIVTNLNGVLVGGDSFQLFTATSRSGNFSATNLPALPPGMNWNWNPTLGTLSVLGVATNPTAMSLAFDGSTLQLTWPADHLGWRLQVQTNDLIAGLGTNWVDVDNSTLTNAVNILIDPTGGNVFYRMIYP